jgi:hypothetical protein
VILLAACSKPAAEVSFDTTLSTKELMKHIVDPAAIALWGRAGTEDTQHGTVYLTPDTEEEWALAEHEAAIVAEAGNLLVLPGRVRKLAEADGDWVRYSRQMTEQALAVKAATEKRDPDKMFSTGGDLYQACVTCHEKYYIPFLKDGVMTDAPRK